MRLKLIDIQSPENSLDPLPCITYSKKLTDYAMKYGSLISVMEK
jgi:hypothetical protein